MFKPILHLIGSQLEAAVDPEIKKRLKQLPNNLNEFNYDAWGFYPDVAQYGLTLMTWLYKYYYRTEVYDIDRVPQGRVLLIANHSGQLPMDGVMIAISMLLEADPPRLVRAMVERWFGSFPLVGTFVARHGSILGDPKNCISLLENNECVLVFPEGVKGSGKVWRDRYQLMDFGLGFMRLALKTKTPIVPVSVIGGEEQAPALYNAKSIAKLLGLPYFPITPTFPWLGLLGTIPYPTKYKIYFGDPLYFQGDPNDTDEEIQKKVDIVKSKIYKNIRYGLAQRENIFW
ncbi:MAG: acyltransferase family protein [Blastocatellia bacterium]|nr:acyltransferase family protein [Blastocatellia bacterium]